MYLFYAYIIVIFDFQLISWFLYLLFICQKLKIYEMAKKNYIVIFIRKSFMSPCRLGATSLESIILPYPLNENFTVHSDNSWNTLINIDVQSFTQKNDHIIRKKYKIIIKYFFGSSTLFNATSSVFSGQRGARQIA